MDTDLAYIAGFFDGEGCIQGIREGKLSITIGNTDRAPLEFVERMLGGAIYNQKGKLWYKQAYVWKIGGRGAAIILKSLLPYLIVKRKQALLGIKLVATTDKFQRVQIAAQIRALKHER